MHLCLLPFTLIEERPDGQCLRQPPVDLGGLSQAAEATLNVMFLQVRMQLLH